jgi:hypothetical protein
MDPFLQKKKKRKKEKKKKKKKKIYIKFIVKVSLC